jgi:hypothetical protein
VARVRPPSTPKGHPPPASQGSPRHRPILAHFRQEHRHSAVQAS